MFKKLHQRIEGEKGFTLIEMLIVIIILGILLAIAVPAYLLHQVRRGKPDLLQERPRQRQLHGRLHLKRLFIGLKGHPLIGGCPFFVQPSIP